MTKPITELGLLQVRCCRVGFASVVVAEHAWLHFQTTRSDVVKISGACGGHRRRCTRQPSLALNHSAAITFACSHECVRRSSDICSLVVKRFSQIEVGLAIEDYLHSNVFFRETGFCGCFSCFNLRNPFPGDILLKA